MGQFSWIDVNDKENITMYDTEPVILLIPKEHKDAVSDFFDIPVGERGISGGYDGYGSVGFVDVYDVAAFLNICACSDADFESKTLSLINSNHWGEKTIQTVKQIRSEYLDGAYRYSEEMDVSGLRQLKDKYGDYSFRELGIHICCEDLNNACSAYPIKMTYDEKCTYENSEFSLGDPEQGWSKTKSKKDAAEFKKLRNKIHERVDESMENTSGEEIE